jgi:hypothetical protein
VLRVQRIEYSQRQSNIRNEKGQTIVTTNAKYHIYQPYTTIAKGKVRRRNMQLKKLVRTKYPAAIVKGHC